MAGFVAFIEGLLPNYVASFLPSSDVVGGVIVLWCFVVFYVVRWWLRKAGKQWRAVMLPTALIAFSLIGLFVGGVWLAKALPNTNVTAENDKKPSVPQSGLAALSNEQLRNAVIEYAKRIRTFEINFRTQEEIQLLSRPPFPPDWQTNPEARAAYSKAADESFQRNNTISSQLRG